MCVQTRGPSCCPLGAIDLCLFNIGSLTWSLPVRLNWQTWHLPVSFPQYSYLKNGPPCLASSLFPSSMGLGDQSQVPYQPSCLSGLHPHFYSVCIYPCFHSNFCDKRKEQLRPSSMDLYLRHASVPGTWHTRVEYVMLNTVCRRKPRCFNRCAKTPT